MTKGYSRRGLLERAGLLAAAGVLAQLPETLRIRGWVEDAQAATAGATRDTFDGLAAFVVPGRDRSSRGQGVRTRRPGGVEAGAGRELVAALDALMPGPTPFSKGVATVLDQTALAVAPSAAHGRFASPFANLSFRQKARTFQLLEADQSPEAGPLRFLAGNLPGLTPFLAYSEAGVLNRKKRRLRARPVGWRLARYTGPADGRREFKGYFQGRRGAGA